ncbi:MAG: hypothetical protein NTNFB01_24270 [Nitrospira sp.]
MWPLAVQLIDAQSHAMCFGLLSQKGPWSIFQLLRKAGVPLDERCVIAIVTLAHPVALAGAGGYVSH